MCLWERTHGNDLARTSLARMQGAIRQIPCFLPTLLPSSHIGGGLHSLATTVLLTECSIAYSIGLLDPDSPHRPKLGPKQPHAVPYPACQPATQLDLDHHSSPFFIEPTQHRTATACRLQRACRPATMSPDCVSPPSRLSQAPLASVATLVVVLLSGGRTSPPAETNTRRRAPDRRLRIAAFAAHLVQRSIRSPPSAIASRVSHAGILLVLRLLDSRPRSCTYVAASLDSTLAHSSSTCLPQ